MNRIIPITVIIIFALASCVQRNNAPKRHSKISASKDTVCCTKNIQYPDVNVNFLDFSFDGSKEDFLRQAESSQLMKVRSEDDSFHITSIFGADWGLNFRLDSLSRVCEVIFITSSTSRDVFENAREDLVRIMGQPYDFDNAEEMIAWYSLCPRILYGDQAYIDTARFRHFRSDDGGWLMYFIIRYPDYGHGYHKHYD